MATRKAIVLDAANRPAEIDDSDELYAPGGVRTRSGETGGGDIQARHIQLSPTGSYEVLDIRSGVAVTIFRFAADGVPASNMVARIGPSTPSIDVYSISVTSGGVTWHQPVTMLSGCALQNASQCVVSGQKTTVASGISLSLQGINSAGTVTGKIDFATSGQIQIANPAGLATPFRVMGGMQATETATAKVFGQTGEFSLGTVGSTAAVDWSANGASQALTLTSAVNCTVSFTAPSVRGWLTLKTISPSSGTVPAITWPASVRWANATKPAQATTLGRANVQRFYFDGTNYWGDAIANAA